MSGYHVCCNQYKNSFFNQFSHLQHEEEFVDLTLAADGYLVKVHKNVVAVASPYLKEMLKSAPSHSPVIFLNKVNHVILKYIIEYIYQGEVNLPVGLLKEFIEVAKSLHINGIYTVDSKKLPKPGRKTIVERKEERVVQLEQQSTLKEIGCFRPKNKIAAHITINNVNNSHSLEVQKCNELETINIASDINNGIEEFETDCIVENQFDTTDYVEENLEYPPENGPIETTITQTFNTEKIKETEYSWTKEAALLSKDNIVENPESILIQNTEHNRKKLEIVIDATNATLNINENTLNVIENTQEITENGTQNVINDHESTIRDAESAKSILNNINSENTIGEKDGMDYDDCSFNTTIQVQPLSPTEVAYLDSLNNIELDKVNIDDLRNMAQYTITQRGSPQLILNRYMYCCQFESRRGLRARWRCIDYRRARCPAMIVTENGKILQRTGAHAHGFHDKKIYKKHRKGLIFNTLDIAKEAYVDNPMQFVD